MPVCPGNSTDCLLGELVDQGRGFDWNLLNFAFTAILSILALLVASLALLQGLLAAGPGRLKASQNVLGFTYGKTARTRFDWTEWRFRTTVQVPIIDVPQIISATPLSSPVHHPPQHVSGMKRVWNFFIRCVQYLLAPCAPQDRGAAKHHQEHDEPDRVSDKASRRVRKRYILHLFNLKHHNHDIDARITDAGTEDVSSSWAMLLRHVGLDAVKLRTRYCKTDHLPADVPAAPAFATIEALIILAVLAGCTSYYVRQDLPLVRGPQVQLVFRQHPSLGLVATYQSYKERIGTKSPLKEHTHWACMEALGHIRYLQQPFLEIRCLPKGQIDYEHVHLLIKSSPSWGDDPRNVIEALKLLPASGKSLLLFRCHTSRRIVAIDPQHSKVEAHHVSHDKSDVESQPLIDDHLAGNAQQSWFGPEVFPGQGVPLKDFPLHPGQFFGHPPEQKPRSLSAADGDLLISADALDLCFHWRDGARYINDLTVPEKTEARKWLAWQLATIDCWLRSSGGQDSLCAALNLLAKLHITEKNVLTVSDGPPHPRLAILDSELLQDSPSPVDANLELEETTDDDHKKQLVLYSGKEGNLSRGEAHPDFAYLHDPVPANNENTTQLLLEWNTDERQSSSTDGTDPAGCIVREPRDDEFYVMSSFTRHIGRCARCPDLYEMHLQQNAPLCDRGWRYARDVASYIYPHNGKPFSVVDREQGDEIELQLDEDISESILALLFAMEHGL
ncbi:hypothetical protein LTR47_007180 [Exophiala xenobiotica]|nr:hypothetical protein LTR41_002513 [Exophiala xenobiotica]KAK5231777.1 hypothetical protein LTR47_007180 [Exophiala xenobiotica]KAK5248941.1 hypothetical protein LTS06_006126 [Exophiala xenobiotica]KAK5348193.1 hypothetical protein LTR61_008051 [Exophiala xenobiotica]KAK5362691.1 hypothetical protein LTR11_009381 [Exophiala xenobiotica]